MRQNVQRGSIVIAVIVLVLVLAAISLGGWYVWNKNRDKDNGPQNSGQPQTQSEASRPEARTEDPYKDWLAHQNTTYGLSFKYPSNWRVDEAEGTTKAADDQHPITVRYAINLELKEQFKYNETMAIEILNQDLEQSASWYDKYYAQSSENSVKKKETTVKGKNAIHYTVTNSGEKSELYLITAGDRAYVVSSIGNPSLDPEFWSKFDKVFESLTIN